MIHLGLWLRLVLCEEKVLTLFRDKLQLNIKNDDTKTLHRLGIREQQKRIAHSKGSLSVLCQGETWTWLSIAARSCVELELCHLADINCNVNAILLSRERLLWLKALSILTYLFVNLPDPPDDLILYKSEALVFRFLWNEKQSRISKMIVCQSCEAGGTGMVDVFSLSIKTG